MDIGKVLQELRTELQQVEEAILSLERMAAGSGRRRGRPPAWILAARETEPVKKRGRPPGSKNRSVAKSDE
jgi:hypothetical protein